MWSTLALAALAAAALYWCWRWLGARETTWRATSGFLARSGLTEAVLVTRGEPDGPGAQGYLYMETADAVLADEPVALGGGAIRAEALGDARLERAGGRLLVVAGDELLLELERES